MSIYGGDWFYTIAYFLAAGMVGWGISGVPILILTRRRRRPVRLAPFALAVTLLPWTPYAVVALQTAAFGPALRPYVITSFDTSGGMAGNPTRPLLRYRVLSISPRLASVYVVQPCGLDGKPGNCATVIDLKRTASGWDLDDYSTIWSDCGNATGNIFPPYPEGQEF